MRASTTKQTCQQLWMAPQNPITYCGCAPRMHFFAYSVTSGEGRLAYDLLFHTQLCLWAALCLVTRPTPTAVLLKDRCLDDSSSKRFASFGHKPQPGVWGSKRWCHSVRVASPPAGRGVYLQSDAQWSLTTSSHPYSQNESSCWHWHLNARWYFIMPVVFPWNSMVRSLCIDD